MSQGFVVTNGQVRYLRKVRPADFEEKTAEVSLSFTVDDGADYSAAVDHVSEHARHHALNMLGIMGGGSRPTAPVSAPSPTATEGTPIAPAGEAAPASTKRTRKTKAAEPEAQPEFDPMAALTDTPETPAGTALDEPAEDAPAEDPLDGLGQTPVPSSSITDEDLGKAANRASAAVRATDGNIQRLIKLINDCGGNGHLTKIPADKRASFLKGAADLK